MAGQQSRNTDPGLIAVRYDGDWHLEGEFYQMTPTHTSFFLLEHFLASENPVTTHIQ